MKLPPHDNAVVDLFAGPGGWDEGLRLAGYKGRVYGIEWDEAACQTAQAAGHLRACADASMVDPGLYVGSDGLIASPPCQAWSRSGKRGGIKDQPRVFDHLRRCIASGAWLPYDRDGWHDDRSALVLEVVRWVATVKPRWIACEQVEDVLPFWQEVVRWLRLRGYSAWAGVLNAEEYGVPQTRRRAILVARRDGVSATPPAATHQRYYPPKRAAAAALVSGDDLFGTELKPWVSMGEALNWTDSRDWVVRTGNNTMSSSRTGSRAGDGGVIAYQRPLTEPAPTVDCGAGNKWRLMAAGQTGEGRPRDPSAPAPTITGKATATWVQPQRDSVQVSVVEAAVLQGFRPDYPWQGNKSAQYRQVGDAVPPPLAQAVVAPLLPVAAQVAA